jgi:heme/copper-type cytochrome/quinol oxidase subunit 3
MQQMAQREYLEQNLSREELQAIRNKRTGLLVFQISWIMVFICLVIVNWQIRSTSPQWPPAGVEPVPWLLPTVATGALALSAFFVRRGLRAVRADAQARFLQSWRVTLALGAVFVAVMIYEFLVIPHTGVYSDLFRMMTGYHLVHALVIGFILARVYRNGRAGHYGPLNFWPVEGAAGLWYFVLVAWLLFFVVLYLL